MALPPEPRTASSGVATSRPPAGSPGDTDSASLPAPIAVPHADPIDAILQVLNQGERFLVCSHARPDGDAVGSMLAMGMLLRQMGKHADLVTPDSLPVVYRGLPDADSIAFALTVRGPYDAVILLECDGPERPGLRGLDQYFLINIDHHVTGRSYANLNWIDHEAVSVGELVYRLAGASGVVITPQMATCLYTTLLTDTDGFCYGSLRASTFALARDLVLAGADPVRIAQDVCFSAPASKMLILGAALSSLKRDGPLAWVSVTLHDMTRACAADEDCEGIVNYALGIIAVEAAAFFRELPESRVRVSLRSKGAINIASIAEQFGGGGHDFAAGCTVDGPLSAAIEHILPAIRAALNAIDPA
jgi:phosphoesterase RecJ-like protein